MAIKLSLIGFSLAFAMAVPAVRAGSYLVAIERADAVSLYDLDSMEKGEHGFSIWTLTVTKHPRFPVGQHPVAFTMQREDYRCEMRDYETPLFKEFGADGTLWRTVETPNQTGRYRQEVLPGSPEIPIFEAGCAPGKDELRNNRGAKLIEASDALAAYHYAADRMSRAAATH